MSILRNRTQGFTVIANTVLRDKNLGITERGLLCTMLSLPDEWEFSENGLQAILPDGQTKIRTALKKLEAAGYLRRTQRRDDRGRVSGWDWEVFGAPALDDGAEPYLENHSWENTNWENRPQLNTKELNTKEYNIYSTSKINLSNRDITREEDIASIGSKAENQPFSPAPVFVLPCVNHQEYGVTQEQVDEWMEAYPNVDVPLALRQMIAWLNANPTRRKTVKGCPRFINIWLGREQDSGRTPRKNNQNGTVCGYDEQLWEESIKMSL